MPQRLIIAEEWQSYATNCIPSDACVEQRRDTRKAFYAGALTTISAIQDALLTGDAKVLNSVLAAIHLDMLTFGREIVREAAEYEARVKARTQ